MTRFPLLSSVLGDLFYAVRSALDARFDLAETPAALFCRCGTVRFPWLWTCLVHASAETRVLLDLFAGSNPP